MNRAAIVSELRRSATEDAAPWRQMREDAFAQVFYWRVPSNEPLLMDMPPDDLRTFQLLVAAAMED